MQSHLTARVSLPQSQPANARQGLSGPRGERTAEESARPVHVVLEPHWVEAIDAATD
jgi:hypothetical protein